MHRSIIRCQSLNGNKGWIDHVSIFIRSLIFSQYLFGSIRAIGVGISAETLNTDGVWLSSSPQRDWGKRQNARLTKNKNK